MLLSAVSYISILITGVIAFLALRKEYDAGKRGISRKGTWRFALLLISIMISLVAQFLSDKQHDDFQEKHNSLLKYSIGDGFGVFNLTGMDHKSYVGSVDNQHNDYPLFGLNIGVIDIEDMNNCTISSTTNSICISKNCYYQRYRFCQVGEIGGRTLSGVNCISFQTNEKIKKLEIRMFSRSSKIIQQSIFILAAGECKQAYRIFDVSDKPFLVKEYNAIPNMKFNWDVEFPRLDIRTFDEGGKCPLN